MKTQGKKLVFIILQTQSGGNNGVTYNFISYQSGDMILLSHNAISKNKHHKNTFFSQTSKTQLAFFAATIQNVKENFQIQ